MSDQEAGGCPPVQKLAGTVIVSPTTSTIPCSTEAADQARRRAQEALQAAEAIAAVSARAEAERKSRGRLARLRAAWWGK